MTMRVLLLLIMLCGGCAAARDMRAVEVSTARAEQRLSISGARALDSVAALASVANAGLAPILSETHGAVADVRAILEQNRRPYFYFVLSAVLAGIMLHGVISLSRIHARVKHLPPRSPRP